MSHTPSGPPQHGWHRALWQALAAAGIITFLLAVSFFWGHHGDSPPLHRISSTLYSSAQILLLHGEPDETEDWRMDVARILAPLVAGLTAVLTVLQVFRKSASLPFLRLRRNHVIVCGLGNKGLQLVKEFRRQGRWVVALEKDAGNPFIPSAEAAGAIVFTGDATSPQFLRKACLHRAKYLIAITGDDGVNVEIAAHANLLMQRGRKAPAEPVRCFVHVVDVELRALFRQHRLFANTNGRFAVKLFNIFENSSRLLMERFPLDPIGFGPNDLRAIHLVIVGFGQMGRSVALQAGKVGNYANGKKLRVSVIDRDAGRKKQGFVSRYPSFGEVCDVDFLDYDAEDPVIMGKMTAWAADENFITTFVICFDKDSHSLSFALNLSRKLPSRTPIRIRMSSRNGFASLISGASDSPVLPGHLGAFGFVSQACTAEMVIHEHLDLLTMAIHKDFVERRSREGRTAETDPALVPWEQLEEDIIDSNRQQVDHIPVKLRAIGCYKSAPRDGETPVEFSNEEIKIMACMEHARWAAERRLNGWTFAPGEKDVRRKTTPYLVAWDELPDGIKVYDLEAVRNIPRLVGLPGIDERIYR